MKEYITPIKDIIHGYIPFSAVEKRIIDSRYFQNLHFILQNSNVFTAYPNNKNTRFSHSLGVAHVAGELFIKSLGNARASDISKFLEVCDDFVREYIFNSKSNVGELESSWRRLVGNHFSFRSTPFDGSSAFVSRSLGAETRTRHLSDEFLVNTFGVAIRVCGLIHDIGHLPMSHLFEDAIKKAGRLFDRYGDRSECSETFKRHAISGLASGVELWFRR